MFLNGFETLNDQVSLSVLVCQDLILARDLTRSPILHQASIEGRLDQAFGSHHDNLPRPLHLSAAIVQVQLERIEGLSIQVACPGREEFLSLCLYSVRQFKPWTEIAPSKVFLSEFGQFVKSVTAFRLLLVLFEPYLEELSFEAISSRLKNIPL